jgi:hypothetical protein
MGLLTSLLAFGAWNTTISLYCYPYFVTKEKEPQIQGHWAANNKSSQSHHEPDLLGSVQQFPEFFNPFLSCCSPLTPKILPVPYFTPSEALILRTSRKNTVM